MNLKNNEAITTKIENHLIHKNKKKPKTTYEKLAITTLEYREELDQNKNVLVNKDDYHNTYAATVIPTLSLHEEKYYTNILKNGYNALLEEIKVFVKFRRISTSKFIAIWKKNTDKIACPISSQQWSDNINIITSTNILAIKEKSESNYEHPLFFIECRSMGDLK